MRAHELEKALVGAVLADRYRLDSPVGRGGFGVVFAGFHLLLEVPVAVKVLHTDYETSTHRERAFQRFHQEAKTLAQLRHPNIARVLDTGLRPADELPELPWLVMEWCDGPTLTDVLAERTGGSSRARVWELARPVIDAVAHAHEQGIVHRDIKPDNIILVDGSPRVLDFGIAKVMAREAPASDIAPTQSPDRAFTPAYGAPEQFAGTRTGPWTDVHALGLILTEMLTGHRPYRSQGGADLMREALDLERPTPATHGVDAGPWESVIACALADEPSARFADGRELLDALARTAPDVDAVSGEDDLTDSASPSTPAGIERRRRENAPTELAAPPASGAPTLPPEGGLPIGEAPTVTGDPFSLTKPRPERSSTPKVVALAVGAIAVVAASWWGWAEWSSPGEVELDVAGTTSPTPSLPEAPPSVPTFHPYDDFSSNLIKARLEKRGWKVTAKGRSTERLSSFGIEREDARGSVVLFRSDTAEALDRFVHATSDTATLRRGASLIHVYVEGDLPRAKSLLDMVTETPEPPLAEGPQPIDGSPWERFEVPTTVDLNDVWGDASGAALACGDHGVLLRFDGREWHRERTGTDRDIFAVWSSKARGDFVVGQAGLVLRRTDEGWEREASGTDAAIMALVGNDERLVAVAGASILERSDGRWTATPSPDGTTIVSAYLEGDELYVIHVDGGVMRWADGKLTSHAGWPETDGSAWPILVGQGVTRVNPKMTPWLEATPEIRWSPVSFTRAGPHLFVVGSKGVILRVEHGLTPDVEPSGTEVRLTAVRSAGDRYVWAIGERGTVLRRPF